MVFSNASSTPAYEEVDDLVSDLTVATSPVSTGNITLFPTDLNITNTVVSDVLNYLTTTAATPQPGGPLPFNEVNCAPKQAGLKAATFTMIKEHQLAEWLAIGISKSDLRASPSGSCRLHLHFM